MATVTQNIARARNYSGFRVERILTITGPSSYTNPGGDPFTPAQAMLGAIEYIACPSPVNAAGALPRTVVYDYTNQAMHWYDPTTGNEIANATDLSGYSFQALILGK